MPLHELGHASVAWLSGHFAVPLPFYTSTGPSERSVLVAFTLAVALLAAVLAGLSERRRYLAWMGGGALVVQAVLTLGVANWRTLRWFTWSGCGGELAWSTLLVVSFYYRLPDRLRWDFVRFVALAAGAFGLVHAFTFWRGVSLQPGYLPMGSALGGSDDPNGDMNKLIGWGATPAGIAAGYLGLGYAGLAIVAAHYVVFLARARFRRRG
jgi:hypothetical protein